MGAREEDDWNLEDPNDPPFSPVGGKRKYRAKKMEFIGWGSRQLIEFLTSLGKDTSHQISQYNMTSIITDYVNNNGLYHPQKKKKIVCDEKLYSLFGKKMVPRIKVYDLLDQHYAENEEDLDEFFSSSDENGEGSSVRYKSSRKLNRSCPETPKSCFAAIVPSNIKLVYLKKGLIEELLKNPETFEGKVVGSFVRIKVNKDKYANYSYQLQQVTGVKMGSGLGEAVAETLLEVPTDMKEVRLSMLSGDNFSEEECKDLQERVKTGSIKKPTVVELQAKVQQLHEDITKHWIKRELSTLKNLIDRANEKGWRKELYEHLERRDLLMKESEQTRLLTEIPLVIAEELEPEVAPQMENQEDFNHEDAAGQNDKEQHANGESSQRLGNQVLHRHAVTSEAAYSIEEMDVVQCSAEPRHNSEYGAAAQSKEEVADVHCSAAPHQSSEYGAENNAVQILPDDQTTCTSTNADIVVIVRTEHENTGNPTNANQGPKGELENSGNSTNADQGPKGEHENSGNATNADQGPKRELIEPKGEHENSGNATNADQGPKRELIELSDDDDDIIVKNGTVQTEVDPSETSDFVVWHYTDPQGVAQGPFSLQLLKHWYDFNFFPSDFMVWKTGQNRGEAVLLAHVLGRVFAPYRRY